MSEKWLIKAYFWKAFCKQPHIPGAGELSKVRRTEGVLGVELNPKAFEIDYLYGARCVEHHQIPRAIRPY